MYACTSLVLENCHHANTALDTLQVFCFRHNKCTSFAWLPKIILAWVKRQMTVWAAITGVIIEAYDF